MGCLLITVSVVMVIFKPRIEKVTTLTLPNSVFLVFQSSLHNNHFRQVLILQHSYVYL